MEVKNVIIEVTQRDKIGGTSLEPPECGVCYLCKSSKEMRDLPCCGNKLCVTCYRCWHIDRQRPDCAFCRRNIHHTEAATTIDLEGSQVAAETTPSPPPAAARDWKVDCCRLVTVVIFWAVATMVILAAVQIKIA